MRAMARARVHQLKLDRLLRGAKALAKVARGSAPAPLVLIPELWRPVSLLRTKMKTR